MSVIAVRPGGFGSHLPHPLPPTHPFLWGGGCIGTCNIWGKSGLLMRTKRVAQMTKVSNCGGHDSGIDYSRYKIRRTPFTRFEGQPLPDSKDCLYQIAKDSLYQIAKDSLYQIRRTAFTRFEGQPLPDLKDSLYGICLVYRPDICELKNARHAVWIPLHPLKP